MKASIPSIIQPKRPAGLGWQRLPNPPELASMGYVAECWHHIDGVFCISAVEVAKPEPGEQPKGPEYHLSMSMRGQARVSRQDARWVLKAFDLADAEEDNHVPHGFVRNFWRPVADRLAGIECACKADEPAIREDKGDFVWRGVTR